MNFLKILKLQTRIIVNSTQTQNFVWKLIAFFVMLFAIFGYYQSADFFTNFLKLNFDIRDKVFLRNLHSFLFAIFLLNIYTNFFFGAASSLSRSLIFYPVIKKKIIFFEALTDTFNLFNLPYFGIYFSTYLLFNDSFLSLHFIKFIVILFLFLFLIGALIFFFRYIILIYFVAHPKKKIFQILSLVLFIILLQLFLNSKTDDNIAIKLYHFLIYFPTGKFLESQIIVAGSYVEFAKIFFYFIFLNLLFFIVNIFLWKKSFRAKEEFNAAPKFRILKFQVPKFLIDLKKNVFKNLHPLLKKEILYHSRSPRIIFLLIVLLFGYSALFYLAVFTGDMGNKFEALHTIKNMGLFFHAILIQIYSGNIFRFDSPGVKSYFILPVSAKDIINSKSAATYYFLFLNFVFISATLIFLRIQLIDYFVFLALLLFIFCVFQVPAILVSIYFPKKVNVNTVNGLNISLIALILFVPLLGIVWFIVNLSLNLSGLEYKIGLIIFSILSVFLFFKFNITTFLADKLLKRKIKLIKKMI